VGALAGPGTAASGNKKWSPVWLASPPKSKRNSDRKWRAFARVRLGCGVEQQRQISRLQCSASAKATAAPEESGAAVAFAENQ
jgi:hypothetical protein